MTGRTRKAIGSIGGIRLLREIRPCRMSSVLAVLALSAPAAAVAAPAATADWSIQRKGELWDLVEWIPHYDAAEGRWSVKSPRVAFPHGAESNPPEWIALERNIALPPADSHILEVQFSHNYVGTRRNRHVLEILVDGDLVAEHDVGEDDTGQSLILRRDLTAMLEGKHEITLALRAHTRGQVTNFGLVVEWERAKLTSDGQARELLPPVDVDHPIGVAEDPPLDRLPTRGADWTGQTIMIKPWAYSQYDIMRDGGGDYPEVLKERFGFNLLNVQPPDAFNRAQWTLTHDEFDRAIEAYRSAGYRIIIYSSVIHMGHAPEWQEGHLTRERPEWVQRDADGYSRRRYGSDWLCPNTGALEYTLAYTLELVQRYRPDGIQLDNNQFHYSNRGPEPKPTCYCDGCQARFREYVSERFGETAERLFGATADEINIPTSPGLLQNVWIYWRHRVWAEVNETFRRALPPEVMLFANTNFYQDSWTRATDMQIRHADLIYSETQSPNSIAVSNRILLGRALSEGRPYWSYLGTFRSDDATRMLLRDPDDIRRNAYAALSHLANPQLVYYGFGDAHNEENRESRELISKILRFRADHPQLYEDLEAWPVIATLFSTKSRNFGTHRLMPAHVEEIIRAGLPLVGLHDFSLHDADLARHKIIVAENVTHLTAKEAYVLAMWIQTGGHLITTGDLGIFDEIGQPRPRPELLGLLGLDRPESGEHGRGAVFHETVEELTARATSLAGSFRFRITGGQSPFVEFRPYRDETGRWVIHLMNHGEPIKEAWTVRLPDALLAGVRAVQYWTPRAPEPNVLTLTANPSNEITLPPMDFYGIIELLP